MTNRAKPVYVAHVCAGFTDKFPKDFYHQFQIIKLDVTPSQVRSMETVTWLEPKLVCELIYQIVTNDCRLKMPRRHTLRIDKELPNALLINKKANANAFPPNN